MFFLRVYHPLLSFKDMEVLCFAENLLPFETYFNSLRLVIPDNGRIRFNQTSLNDGACKII